MTGKDDQKSGEPRLKALLCPRCDRQLELAEHARCPYCFGDEVSLRRGDRAEFCDFHPGKDPVHFGFPEEAERDGCG